jgi:transposase-like protein
MKKEKTFDYQELEAEALEALRAGKPLEGVNGVFGPLLKRILEASLEGEMENHLSEERSEGRSNRRNGRSSKTVRTSLGPLEIEQSRDRAGTFEPEIIGKRQREIGHSVENKVLSMYASGMTYESIEKHLEEIYGLEISSSRLSAITDKIWPEIVAWQSRTLDSCYPVLWLDAMYFKVRNKEGRVENRCLYTVLGLDVEGKKTVLGMWMGHETGEGAKFWLQVLTQLQQQGVKEILIACIDNLKGFAEAIATVFPQTRVQLCIVHQIRNSMRFVTTKDAKAFMVDLRKVYQAPGRESAEAGLDALESIWGEKYGIVIKSWRSNWDLLSEYFAYGADIRRMIYTTNPIEGYHRQVRKITKTRGAFPSEKSLLKLVYLVQSRITDKWSKPIHNWGLVVAQLSLLFEERINAYLKI